MPKQAAAYIIATRCLKELVRPDGLILLVAAPVFWKIPSCFKNYKNYQIYQGHVHKGIIRL
jgi:hypothetical protein